MSQTANVTQYLLPGQAAAPEGPIDMLGMYLMHHGFRRDLDAFIDTVPRTAIGDRASWAALEARWKFFAFVLHHHHCAEDVGLWPPLLERVDAAGDTEARMVLHAMEAEHAEIDPLLQACADGFARLSRTADQDAQAALAVRLVGARQSLGHHLGHEETDAIPLIQQYIDNKLWAELEKKHFSAGYTLGQTLRVLGWVMYRLPEPAREAMFAQSGVGMFRQPWKFVIRPWFEKGERRAFGLAD